LVEFWGGRWQLAADHAAAAYDIAIQYGLEVPQDHLPIALVALHRGRLEPAREHSTRALELAEEQFALHPPQHLAILGLAALWGGDPAEAVEWLARAEAQAAALAWGEPSIRWWSADHVELLLELGRVEEGVRILDAWEADALRLGRNWVLAPRDALPRARRCGPRKPGSRRHAPPAGGRAPRGGRRPVRSRPCAARARRRPPTRAAEARGR
jgi:hypothetical protein